LLTAKAVFFARQHLTFSVILCGYSHPSKNQRNFIVVFGADAVNPYQGTKLKTNYAIKAENSIRMVNKNGKIQNR